MEKRHLMWLVAATAGVLLLTLLVYWPGLAGPFVLDDLQNIVKTQVTNPDLSQIIYIVTHNHSGMLGRSVSVLSFVLTSLQFGIEPWGYKFHNLLIHLGCGLLMFRLLWILLQQFEQGRNSRSALLVAGIVSALWLLHPLLVSTVLYSVQRMAQLTAFFSLLALLCYVSARLSAEINRHRFLLMGWILFPLCLVLAIFSKENGVTIPLYVLVTEVLIFRTTTGYLRKNPALFLWLVTFVALPLLLGGLYLLSHLPEMTDYSVRNFTLAERLMTQLHVIFMYARLILLPRISDMSLFLDDFPLTQAMDISTMLLLISLFVVAAVIWLARRRLPVLAFGLAWFMISHLLESTIFPLELVFEHRNYLAAMGLLLPPVWAVFRLTEARVLHWALGIYALIFAGQLYSRVQEWSSEAMLMSVAVIDHPASPRAHILYSNYLNSQGLIDAAIAELRIAQELRPEDAGTSLHLEMYYCIAGKRDDELLMRTESQLRTYPITSYALNGIENLLNFFVRGLCTKFTLEDFDRLIQAALAQPNNLANSLHHGYLKRFHGIVAFQRRQYAQGAISLREAHGINGQVSILAELVRYQIAFNRLEDAADTLAYIEELNSASFGIENYMVDTLHAALAAARLPKPAADDTQNFPVPLDAIITEEAAVP